MKIALILLMALVVTGCNGNKTATVTGQDSMKATDNAPWVPREPPPPPGRTEPPDKNSW